MTPLKKNISFNIHDVNTWKEKNLSKKKEKLKKNGRALLMAVPTSGKLIMK